jgi:hypothetical protein
LLLAKQAAVLAALLTVPHRVFPELLLLSTLADSEVAFFKKWFATTQLLVVVKVVFLALLTIRFTNLSHDVSSNLHDTNA